MLIRVFKGRDVLVAVTAAVAVLLVIVTGTVLVTRGVAAVSVEEDLYAAAVEGASYIKWVDFTPPYNVLKTTLELDVKSHRQAMDDIAGGTITAEEAITYDWIDLLAYLGAKYGGEFNSYKEKDLTAFLDKLKEGSSVEELTAEMKHFNYYKEAYTAVLAEYVGAYRVEVEENGEVVWAERYGLKAFSPIAKGYAYNDFDDFGVGRSYGYQRKHLGHDMMGLVGTPIIAVESGVVEELGWNQYGGWRIGIRSFDGQRYYYYAHLRQNRPYHVSMEKGANVTAGDVIGYMGRTGYSTKENVNNIEETHLHFGVQLIFDEVQKDGVNQIWIDLYDITRLLQHNRSTVYRDDNKEYHRTYAFEELEFEG